MNGQTQREDAQKFLAKFPSFLASLASFSVRCLPRQSGIRTRIPSLLFYSLRYAFAWRWHQRGEEGRCVFLSVVPGFATLNPLNGRKIKFLEYELRVAGGEKAETSANVIFSHEQPTFWTNHDQPKGAFLSLSVAP